MYPHANAILQSFTGLELYFVIRIRLYGQVLHAGAIWQNTYSNVKYYQMFLHICLAYHPPNLTGEQHIKFCKIEWDSLVDVDPAAVNWSLLSTLDSLNQYELEHQTILEFIWFNIWIKSHQLRYDINDLSVPNSSWWSSLVAHPKNSIGDRTHRITFENQRMIIIIRQVFIIINPTPSPIYASCFAMFLSAHIAIDYIKNK